MILNKNFRGVRSRIRSCPESSRILERLVTRGQLEILGGRVLDCIESGDGVRITFRERLSGKEMCIFADLVINCTGDETGNRMFEDPCVKSLLDLGIARVDEIGLGLDVAAVLEIRSQAMEIADCIRTLL
jgi:uncharacterized NAD(P)/FAD-binding protein YdhS